MPLSVHVDFDRPRKLRFDLSAIEDLESATGHPLGTLVHHLSQLSPTTLKLALWAGLKHEDKSLTPNLVRKMLQAYIDDEKDIKVLMDAVSEAIDGCGLLQRDGPSGNGKPGLETASHSSSGNG